MPDAELVNYIDEQLKSGYDINVIRQACVEAGHSLADVEEAIHFCSSPGAEDSHSPATFFEEQKKRLRYRSVLVTIFIGIITVGLYWLYWYYHTSLELVDVTQTDVSPGLLTMLLLIPLAGYYSIWKHTEMVAKVSGASKPFVMTIWVLLPIFGAGISQYYLNLALQEAFR